MIDFALKLLIFKVCKIIATSKIEFFNVSGTAKFNDGTGRTTVDFASALNNPNVVKLSDLLEFLVILLFSTSALTWKLFPGAYTSISCKIKKTSMREFNLKKVSKKRLFPFRLKLGFYNLQNHIWQLLSYEVTLVIKCKKQCQKKVK